MIEYLNIALDKVEELIKAEKKNIIPAMDMLLHKPEKLISDYEAEASITFLDAKGEFIAEERLSLKNLDTRTFDIDWRGSSFPADAGTSWLFHSLYDHHNLERESLLDIKQIVLIYIITYQYSVDAGHENNCFKSIKTAMMELEKAIEDIMKYVHKTPLVTIAQPLEPTPSLVIGGFADAPDLLIEFKINDINELEKWRSIRIPGVFESASALFNLLLQNESSNISPNFSRISKIKTVWSDLHFRFFQSVIV